MGRFVLAFDLFSALENLKDGDSLESCSDLGNEGEMVDLGNRLCCGRDCMSVSRATKWHKRSGLEELGEALELNQ